MELINFKVGCKTISLKILDILLTERFNNDLTTLPNNNKSFIGVKDYMETPTPVFDLGIILNGNSTEQSNKHALEQLRKWQESLEVWFTRLENNLTGNNTTITTTSTELHNFEMFYQEFKTDNEDLQAIIGKFDRPFKSLLQTVDKAIKASADDNKKQVSKYIIDIKQNSLMQLLRLFEAAKEQITLDYKPIIVFTTKDGSTPHVGLLVDKVEDNVDYKKEDIKPLDKLTEVGFDIDPQTKNMMRGLIELAEKHSVLIDPSAIFSPVCAAQEDVQESEAYGLF
ncbi:chemotaxis protein [Pseudoalteromonas sp. MMG006]|uniref:chemotaxis protein n=1 Tax=Pseudoalteromonas sp. MMG006 TaxID=2822683 RepID=UPI001B35CBAD|nr:chemotaxis protein [Pseudoalteromonas sp. MMG006]MBQ4800988.1 chemotaxis protein [Pseudoalteromonas sp. MMG006]